MAPVYSIDPSCAVSEHRSTSHRWYNRSVGRIERRYGLAHGILAARQVCEQDPDVGAHRQWAVRRPVPAQLQTSVCPSSPRKAAMIPKAGNGALYIFI